MIKTAPKHRFINVLNLCAAICTLVAIGEMFVRQHNPLHDHVLEPQLALVVLLVPIVALVAFAITSYAHLLNSRARLRRAASTMELKHVHDQ